MGEILLSVTKRQQAADLTMVKRANTSLIANTLRTQGPLSKAQLSRITNLTKSTVSSIVNELIAQGIVREAGIGSAGSTGGRRPVMLELNEHAFYVVGLDIGTTAIHAIVTNLTGVVLNEKRILSLPRDGLHSLIHRTVQLIQATVQESGVEMQAILGVGVAAAGLVDHQQGLIRFSPNFGWRNVPLGSLLQEVLNVPVWVDNCTRVMARGEMWFGSGKDVSNLLYVNVGYGIGSALVIDGELLGRDSEMGHVTVQDDGPLCGCGKHGCVEAISSGSAIEARAREAAVQQHSTLLLELCQGDVTAISGEMVASAAEAGDLVSQKIISEAGEYLGRAIAAVVNAYNPELVIVGGGVSQAGKLFLEPVRRGFQKHVMPDFYAENKIVGSRLGTRGGVLGGAGLVLGKGSELDVDLFFEQDERA